MATRISEIVEKQAYDQIAQLNKMLGDALDMFNKTANGAILLNKAISESNSFVQAANNTNSTTKALTELEKIERQIITTQSKLNASQSLQAQILAEEKMKLQELNKETKDFIKSKQVQAGSIEELRMKLGAAQQEYDAMAASERNAGRGTDLINHIQKVDKELKQLEFNSGRFQRNVGNYASGFSAINNSVSQLAREMPAFTNSVQTGFMAISNNLPALFDSIKGIREENKLAKIEAVAAAEAQGLLAREQAVLSGATDEAADKIKEQATALALSSAEGVKGKGVLKQLAGAFFSWNTLLTIGITLLTVYGKDIVDWIVGTEKADESQKKLNEEMKEGNKQMSEAIGKARLQMAVIIDVNNSYKDRSEAYDSLNRAYPELLSNMNKEEALNGGIAESYDGIVLAIEKAMKKKAQYSQLEAAYAEKVRVEAEIARLTKPQQGAFIYYDEEYMNKLNRDLALANDRIKSINASIQKQNELEGMAFGKSLFKPTSSDKKEAENSKKSVENAKKTKDEKVKIDKEYVSHLMEIDRQVQLMNEKTDDATIDRVTKGLEEKKRLNAKYAKEELDLINENLAANAVMWDNADQERLEASIKRLETFQAAAGIIQNALNNIGGIISDRANLKADQAVKEIDRVKEAELAALDKVAMSTQQKEEEKKRIETQAEARRKQIERERITALRKAAQFQKAADIASIISSTAAAIMGFQKNPGGPAGITLSIAAGVTGGIQLARAAAAPLPQYFKGRKGGKMEFAEVNEKGPELLETKDGKFSIANGGKRGVTLLQEGEKVHTNESFMKMVSNRAHSILSTHPTPNSNSYERAYLQAINEMKDEFTGMKQMLKQKKDGFIIKGNFGHDIYVDSIRM